MFLKTVVLQNFRGYRGTHRIDLDAFTTFVGRNDAGKSSIFDALAVFFAHSLGKIDASDFCVHAGEAGEIRIGCIFGDLPTDITIDETSVTGLAGEYLLNADGRLEIHKVWEYADGALKKPKVFAHARHPSANGINNLLSKKNTELRASANAIPVADDVDRRSNTAMRRAIWASAPDLALHMTDLQLDTQDAKTIWERLAAYLPEFALFRADRPSTDEDVEVQDPLRVAVKQAMEEVQAELELIKNRVKERALDVATRTIGKLADFDETLASQLTPDFKADPKWDSLFKLTLSGDDDIPVNKRGSGVRRLVLFSFFRAEAERLRNEHEKANIIYAIEEPETAQHPNNQRKILEALQEISIADGCQVMITTHVPALASLVPIESVRHVSTNAARERSVQRADDNVLQTVAADLGIIPDKRVRVLLCVEGPHDVQFLKHVNKLFRSVDPNVIDIATDPRVAFVVLGGSTLQEWVNQHYLRNLALPEVHVYDRDVARPDGTFKYQGARDEVNARVDGSRAYLTQKRELENYLHMDAVNEALAAHVPAGFAFALTDDCDVEEEIKAAAGRGRFDRKSVKYWLNEEAASRMTIARLQQRNADVELLDWFTEIRLRAG